MSRTYLGAPMLLDSTGTQVPLQVKALPDSTSMSMKIASPTMFVVCRGDTVVIVDESAPFDATRAIAAMNDTRVVTNDEKASLLVCVHS